MAVGSTGSLQKFNSAFSDTSNMCIVLGAGASIALTEDATLSWPGFLVSMIDYAFSEGLCTPRQRKLLEDHKAKLVSGRINVDHTMISEDISRLYKSGKNGRLYEAFLNHRIANVNLRYSSSTARYFLETIARFNCPILTTNYDDMFERGLGIRSLTLDNVSYAVQVLRRKEQCVIHLHGIYTNPNSIVLAEKDYKTLVANENWRAFVDALHNKTLLFIGFGNSMFDSAFKVFRKHAFNEGPKTISHWHWLLSDEDRQTLDKQIRSANRSGERLPNIVGYAVDKKIGHTSSLCNLLNSNIAGQIYSAPRRVPIVSELTTSIGHEVGFAQASEVKLIANKGHWIRANVDRLLSARTLDGSAAKLKVILCAPSYTNYLAYLDADTERPLLNYREFIDQIMESIDVLQEMKTKYPKPSSVEVRLSENYHLLRISLFGNNAYVTRLSRESSMLLRRRLFAGTTHSDDEYEDAMLSFFDKYFEFLWKNSVEIDLSQIDSEGIVLCTYQVDKTYHKMRDRLPGSTS